MFGRLMLGMLSAALMGSVPSPAAAQALTVMPVVIDMQPGQLAATLSISGQGATETSYQVRAFAWRQNGDADQLDPTNDVLLSPPLGVIAPNGTQIVRIVVRTAPRDRESVYRILLDQIPPPSAPGTVRIAIRLSLPVFVEPTTRVAPHVEWKIERDKDGISLVAVNSGNKHERIHDIVLTAGTATLKPMGDASPYLLAGSTRHFRLAGDGAMAAPDSDFHLTAQSDGGKIDVIVHSTRTL